jgi:hypothetical protein
LPVTFVLSSNGSISVTLGSSITTPIGTFSLDASVGVPLKKSSTRLSIIRTIDGNAIRTVYDIGEIGPMNVCLDGSFLETIANRNIAITALNNVSQISIIDARHNCPEPASGTEYAPSTPAGSSPRVPTGLLGTWSGDASEGSTEFSVEVAITQAPLHGSLGEYRIVLPGTGLCTFSTVLTGSGSNQVQFQTSLTSGTGCEAGTVTLSLNTDGSANYLWTGTSGVANGTLNRN